MNRYYFDFDTGLRFYRDPEGIKTDDIDEVRREAIAILPEMVKDVLPDCDHRVFKVQVRDHADRVIFKATLTFNSERLNIAASAH
jgi:bifunctional DNase/RNase